MEINQKNVFWEALVVSLFVLGLGFFLGMFLENARSNESLRLYLSSESNLLDIQLFSNLIKDSNQSCEALVEKNLEFGDKIYTDARRIERYEDAKKITSDILEQHRKYDILRTIFWMNSIKIKEQCNKTSTIVYLYRYNPEDRDLEVQQKIYSNYLYELKEKFGGDIVLIPIATNMELSSLDILMSRYNLRDFGIFVDERLFIERTEELPKIEEYLSQLYHNKP